MYEEFWELDGSPFPSTIDDRWLYESPAHEEALARLQYVVEGRRPLGVLTGPPGTGKSLLLKVVEKRSRRKQCETAFIDLCGLDADDFVFRLAAALHLVPDRSDLVPLPQGQQGRLAPFWMSLRDQLLGRAAAQVHTVFLLDHFDRSAVQATRVLERLLALDESHRWCTVLLAMQSLPASGLPIWDIADLRIETGPLDHRETVCYVSKALERAGARQEIFRPEALDVIFRFTGGVPRAINRLCDMAMLAAMSEGRTTIDAGVVRGAAEQLSMASVAGEHVSSDSAEAVTTG